MLEESGMVHPSYASSEIQAIAQHASRPSGQPRVGSARREYGLFLVDSPQRCDWFFLERRLRPTHVGKMDFREEGFNLRVVRYGNSSPSARRTVEAIPPIGAT